MPSIAWASANTERASNTAYSVRSNPCGLTGVRSTLEGRQVAREAGEASGEEGGEDRGEAKGEGGA